MSLVRLRPVWLTNHPPSVLWHCWLGHQTRKKTVGRITYIVLVQTLYHALSINQKPTDSDSRSQTVLMMHLHCIILSILYCVRCQYCKNFLHTKIHIHCCGETGRSIAELQVGRVRAAFVQKPFETSVGFAVHSLLVADALQVLGRDYELLVASHHGLWSVFRYPLIFCLCCFIVFIWIFMCSICDFVAIFLFTCIT